VFRWTPRLTRAVNLSATSGDIADVGGRRIALDSRLAARYGLTVGSDFTAEFRTGRETLRVVAIFDPVIVFQGILTDLALAEELGAPADGIPLPTSAWRPERIGAGEPTSEVVAGNPSIRFRTHRLCGRTSPTPSIIARLRVAMLALAVLITCCRSSTRCCCRSPSEPPDRHAARNRATRQEVRRTIVIEATVLGVWAICGAALGVGWLLCGL
jgi:hypothetical protein